MNINTSNYLPPDDAPTKFRKWFGKFNVVYQINQMKPEIEEEKVRAPDTKIDPPMLHRMIPLPLSDEEKEPIMKEDNKGNIIPNGGVVNPAFETDSMNRLHVTGNTWSETSSDNNKDDTLDYRKQNRFELDPNHMQKSQSLPNNYSRMNIKDSRTSTLMSEPEKTATLKSWDVFRVVSRGKENATDDAHFNIFQKIVKVIVSVFLTILVLVATMLSKSSLFLITSNVYTNVTLECVKVSDTEVTSCRRIPPDRRSTGEIFKPSQTVQVNWIWALVIVVCTPYMFTFTKCFWRMCFKKTRAPTMKIMALVLCIETIHTLGTCIFAFYVLPSMDPIRGLMLTFGVGLIPSLLKLFDHQGEDGKKTYSILLDSLAVALQVSILLLWPIRNLAHHENYLEVWAIPVSLLLISIGWWENYVNKFTGLGKFGAKMKQLKHCVRRMRTKLYAAVGIWKTVLTLALMTVLFSEGKMSCLQKLYFADNGFPNECPHLMNPSGNDVNFVSYYNDPFWVAIMQIFSSLLCYQCAKTSCKIMLQIVSFSLPLMLAAPIMAGLFIGNCETWKINQNDDIFMPEYLYWTCDIHGISRDFVANLVSEYYLPVALGWWLSFMWVTFHIWLPRVERLVQTEKLFVQPLYCGVMLEQSLMLNRRRDDKDRDHRASEKRNQLHAQLKEPYPTELPPISTMPMRKETTPMIYVCATMWHETEKEMLQMLTSVFRMDNDQCARRNAQKFFDIVDPDYYEFEAHIFFDDAFDPHDDTEYQYQVNNFVKQLVNVMDKAASKVHKVPVRIAPPTKYPTPYGGRLEWSMLGGNKLVAHMKDKTKIRHRKRWSQVMYMYYLLGHRLVGQTLDARRKQTIADNTFILTLDGDVDFKPSAVQLLVDRMRKNEKVGAACGRIHPVGMGPMIWYQKFEYAISHWLQKATEHMIGCVLCSPGCFSLFRASSLMDDNVMGKYASMSSQAKHYVQYDQGEDRWLCTLLLQQGYRVEYCAAADALTFAPEGFREFYNQRRRWSPSTMANIMDLLGDWKNVIRLNENISGLYIFYQLLLFVSSLITPGTIFLLITGALNTAFPEIDLIKSLIINAVPVGIFMASCYLLSSKWQLRLASVLSLIYALVMMVVVVGLCLQLVMEGICSPTAIFLIFLVSVFFISATLHPQEFLCICHGALYFLAVPSMSMLLMVYSICNLHVVSWGTRETAQAASPGPQKKTTKESKLHSFLQRLNNNNEDLDSEYGFSLGNLFKCLCCPRPREDASNKKFDYVLEKLANIEKALRNDESDEDKKETKDVAVTATFETITEDTEPNAPPTERPLPDQDNRVMYNPVYQESVVPFEDEFSPFWVQDDDIGDGRIRYISKEEKTFWKDMIDKYLFPLENDDAHQKKIQQDLLELRNKMSLMFFMLNGLFIVIIFTLQYTNAINKGHGLSIPIPCKARNGRNLTLEPLSLLFMAVFGIALVIQFISMFFHRLGTFLHIIASTEVNCMKPNQNEITQMDIASKVQLVKEMQSFEDDDDTRSVTTTNSDADEDSSLTQDDTPKMKRRKTVIRITKRKHKPAEQRDTLGTKFVKNFMELANDLRKERVSETSNKSGDRGKDGSGRRSSDKKRSRKAMRALGSLQQDKNIVLRKADAIETKWQKLAAKGRGDTSQGKVDKWLHLVRDVIGQSRTSLTTIGDDEKRSSFPWRRGGVSRSNSIELPREDQIKTRSLPKRASYAGTSSLNIINDEEEPSPAIRFKEPTPSDAKIKENRISSSSLNTYDTVDVVVEREPNSFPLNTYIISEENAEAHSIESESEFSDESSVQNETTYIELRETSSKLQTEVAKTAESTQENET